MQQILATELSILPLGRQGEHLVRQMLFNVADWRTLYGEGTVELLYQRPGNVAPSPRLIEQDGDTVIWTVRAWDTEIAGYGYGSCELRYYVGEALAKSRIWKTAVQKALDAPDAESPEDPVPGWVDQVLQAGADAKNSAAIAAKAAESVLAGEKTALEAAASAEESRIKAEFAQEASQTAQTAAENAKDKAVAAQREALKDRDRAESARLGAETAYLNARSAQREAQTAQGYAEEARRFAEEAAQRSQKLAEELAAATETALKEFDAGLKEFDEKADEVLGELGKVAYQEDIDKEIDRIDKELADLKYKPIEITAFAHDLPTQELGAVVRTVTLAWALSKDAASLKLDGATVDPVLREKTLTGLEIAKTRSFTLVATDERGASVSKTASLPFYNGIYHGAAAAPTNLNSAFVLKLTKTLTGSKNRTVKISGGDGLYAWYAYPKRMGKSLFNIGGFDYDWMLETVSFTNSLGYTEDYYVYRSGQYAPASLSVTVKDGG